MRSIAALLVGVSLLPAVANAWLTVVPGLQAPIGGQPIARSSASTVTTVPNGVVVGAFGHFFVIRLDDSNGQEIWRYDGDSFGAVRALEIDGAGDVVAVGFRGDFLGTTIFTVAKLAGATGMELWRHDVMGTAAPIPSGPNLGGGLAVAIDASGDVIAAGSVVNTGTADDAIVVKLSGTTGAELWRYTADAAGNGRESAFAVEADALGDAVAVATLITQPSVASVSRVVKLAGTTGTPLWSKDFADTYTSYEQSPGVAAIVLDGAGDVAAEGFTIAGPSDPLYLVQNSVFLLSGADGSELWRHDYQAGPSYVTLSRPLAITPSGDLAASDRQFTVAVLSVADGHEIWRHTLGCDRSTLLQLTVDGAGNVITTGLDGGCASGTPSPIDFVVAKLAAADGSALWQRQYDADQPSFEPADVIATPGGRIVVAGSVVHNPGMSYSTSDFAVLGLDAATGGAGICRDGYVDPGEQCDDGNTNDTDCCTSTCTAMPDGTTCSDGNHCTTNDTCRAAVCQPGPPLPCKPCGTCDPAQGCMTSLPFACLSPTATARALLSLDVDHPTLAWDWKSGAATAKSDFGDPRTATGYALCVYGDQPEGAPLFRATATPGKSCAKGKGCWRKTSKGFHYESGSKSPDGLSTITLQAGGPGKARIAVRGKGKKLDLPPLPLAALVTVQLRKLDGSPPCWSAEHATVIKNTARHFVARGD